MSKRLFKHGEKHRTYTRLLIRLIWEGKDDGVCGGEGIINIFCVI